MQKLKTLTFKPHQTIQQDYCTAKDKSLTLSPQ
nr:MAG TPA: hypothetical protein [Caudoviricetes sp.]